MPFVRLGQRLPLHRHHRAFQRQRLLAALDALELCHHFPTMNPRFGDAVRPLADPPVLDPGEHLEHAASGSHLDPAAHAIRSGDAAHAN